MTEARERDEMASGVEFDQGDQSAAILLDEQTRTDLKMVTCRAAKKMSTTAKWHLGPWYCCPRKSSILIVDMELELRTAKGLEGWLVSAWKLNRPPEPARDHQRPPETIQVPESCPLYFIVFQIFLMEDESHTALLRADFLRDVFALQPALKHIALTKLADKFLGCVLLDRVVTTCMARYVYEVLLLFETKAINLCGEMENCLLTPGSSYSQVVWYPAVPIRDLVSAILSYPILSYRNINHVNFGNTINLVLSVRPLKAECEIKIVLISKKGVTSILYAKSSIFKLNQFNVGLKQYTSF
ncbi:hypothetical protein C8R44DRAFT_728016 [Mycena epipterygia]|nr:hypothetical protein C8R44DRAFT_728016 [Mycena epipterygia]